MIARTLTVDVGRDRLDAVLETYRAFVRPIHARARGLHAHFVLTNRDVGRITFIGVWESAAALQEIAGELEPARDRLWQTFNEAPVVEVYDVADRLDSTA